MPNIIKPMIFDLEALQGFPLSKQSPRSRSVRSFWKGKMLPYNWINIVCLSSTKLHQLNNLQKRIFASYIVDSSNFLRFSISTSSKHCLWKWPSKLQIRWASEDNSEIIFLFLNKKHMLLSLTRTVLVRRFWWGVTTYIFIEKYGQLYLNFLCYPFL